MSIRSMTGYGQASTELGDTRVSVELRTVNHRYADLRLRLPQGLAPLEPEIRRRVLGRVRRGRIELAVAVEPRVGRADRPRLNVELLEEVLAAAKRFREEHGLEGRPGVEALLGVPGMFRSGAPEPDWQDEGRAALERALDAALAALDDERRREGAHLQQDLVRRVDEMIRIAAAIRARAEALPAVLHERLVERLRALAADVTLDPARVAQEAAILADRADVTEELVRLEGHLSQVRGLLERPDGDPLGKRLDFLMQEIGRETNTVNSKSADLELGRSALALKAEIEKVREQVQNVE